MVETAAFREPFDRGTDRTIGVEEEFFLLGDGPQVAWEASEVLEELADDRFKHELPAAQLEHVTAPCTDLAEVARRLTAARRDLVQRSGRRFASAGTHPLDARVLSTPADPSYDETIRRHPWAARRQMVGALQVHVAVGPADVALAVHDALRSYLPDLVAVAANSPFRDGEDTGLACVRPLVATLLPRQGIPPAYGTWEAYGEMRRWMDGAGVTDERRIWWEVRLRPEFGTIEVRAMDAQATAHDAAAVTALAAATILWLAGRAGEGQPLPVHATERIAENRWRAVRDGGRARMLDLDTGDEQPLAARLGRLVESVAPTASAVGGDQLLDRVLSLASRTGADRQRDAARDRGAADAATWLAEVFCQPD